MIRAFRRAVALGFALIGCLLHYWILRLRGPLTLEQRALWLQAAARGVLASLGIRFQVEGQAPARGLVVSNHLSYLDILIFAAAMPCCFVSKIEVARWPFFGKAAQAGGTIFLDRSSHSSASAAAAAMAERLTGAVPVLLFPEGTSTDGSRLLHFHARLIQPAVQAAAPVTAAAIRYLPPTGTEERDLCWYGDEPFLPHLLRALKTAAFAACVRFDRPRVYADSRLAAEEMRNLVAQMRASANPV